MYDDRYDGKIDEVFFEKKLKEYKDREFAILQEMEGHAKGDESFHVTANMVLGLAKRASARVQLLARCVTSNTGWT